MFTIKATANKSKRTFTLRKLNKYNAVISKYLTLPMNREEFEDAENNTSDDWKVFLCREEVERIY